jgi:hypothetical protein
MGRILGLGSVLDGKDIMEPRYTPERVTGAPKFSTLDLYALHILAQGSAPNFVTLPAGVQNQFTPATAFLPNLHQRETTSISGAEESTPQVTQTLPVFMFRHFHFLMLFPV